MRTVLVGELVPGLQALGREESHHLLRVLRLERGGELRVVDGEGRETTATLVDVRDGLAWVELNEVRAAPPLPPTIVLLGTPKPALVEEAVTLGTELGATAFWLVRTDRSPPGDTRPDRLARILDAALKQCRRADRPEVRSFVGLAAAFAALGELPEAARYLGAPGGLAPRDAVAAASSGVAADPGGVAGGGAPRPKIVAIGPEGGFTAEEVESFLSAGFVPTDLGPSILRAPTAVAALLAVTST